MTTSSEDAELVRRAKSGCAESVAVLAARHQVALVHYAARMLIRRGGSRADAEDVVQETLVQAFGRLEQLDDHRAFAAWLFAIVRRRSLNHLRAVRRRTTREAARAVPLTSAPGDDPQAVATAREESERLWAVAARELPERQFSALWLRTVEDLPVADIARVLGRPPATVKVLLFRGRRRLAAVLELNDEPATVPLRARAAATPLTRRSRHG